MDDFVKEVDYIFYELRNEKMSFMEAKIRIRVAAEKLMREVEQSK